VLRFGVIIAPAPGRFGVIAPAPGRFGPANSLRSDAAIRNPEPSTTFISNAREQRPWSGSRTTTATLPTESPTAAATDRQSVLSTGAGEQRRLEGAGARERPIPGRRARPVWPRRQRRHRRLRRSRGARRVRGRRGRRRGGDGSDRPLWQLARRSRRAAGRLERDLPLDGLVLAGTGAKLAVAEPSAMRSRPTSTG